MARVTGLHEIRQVLGPATAMQAIASCYTYTAFMLAACGDVLAHPNGPSALQGTSASHKVLKFGAGAVLGGRAAPARPGILPIYVEPSRQLRGV